MKDLQKLIGKEVYLNNLFGLKKGILTLNNTFDGKEVYVVGDYPLCHDEIVYKDLNAYKQVQFKYIKARIKKLEAKFKELQNLKEQDII